MALDYRKAFGGSRASFLSKQDIGMARPSRYAHDGFGRDTYIGDDNGGLYRMHRPASCMTIGTFT